MVVGRTCLSVIECYSAYAAQSIVYVVILRLAIITMGCDTQSHLEDISELEAFNNLIHEWT